MSIFYGVGVGPGDPGLLTVKALRVLQDCPVIAAPRTRSGQSLALGILQRAMDLTGKTLVPLPVAMTRDPDALRKEHRQAAGLLRPYLAAGQDVAMLTLGDVSVYSTVHYVLDILRAEGWPTRLIPGVPSFCAVAAALGQSLTAMDEPLHIYPAGVSELSEALNQSGSKVLMKSGKRLPQVVQAVREHPAVQSASLALNCGLPGQTLYPRLQDYQGEDGYFATLLVKGEAP